MLYDKSASNNRIILFAFLVMYKDEKTHAADDRCPDYASHTKSNHEAVLPVSAPFDSRKDAETPLFYNCIPQQRCSDQNRHIAVLDIIFIFFIIGPSCIRADKLLNNLFLYRLIPITHLFPLQFFSILTHPFNSTTYSRFLSTSAGVIFFNRPTSTRLINKITNHYQSKDCHIQPWLKR